MLKLGYLIRTRPLWKPAHVAQWSTSCAVEHDVPQEPGSKLSPDASICHQRIISNNSYAHDEQGDNPGREKDGSTVFSIICDCC